MAAVVLHDYSKATPDFVTRELAKFGTNPHGQPLYRVVWSETQTYRCWKRNDEGRMVEYTFLTYPGVQRWILETWCPPHKYGTQFLWERQNKDGISLGPYPSQGRYEHSYTLEYDNQFVQLTLPTLELICQLIEQGKESTFRQKREALLQQKQREDKAWKDQAQDIIHDAQSPFSGQPMSGYGGTTKRRDASDIKITHTTKDLPVPLQNKRGFFQT